MKRLLLLATIAFTCASFANAQDCKMCGIWNGAIKDVFPSGETFRVSFEFTIEGNKKFEYHYTPEIGTGRYKSSENVIFVDDACNDHFIKYYMKEKDEWAREKFKGKRVEDCITHSFYTLELKEKNTIIYRKLGTDYFYYDEYGDNIGKEWKDGPDNTFVCILHQLED